MKKLSLTLIALLVLILAKLSYEAYSVSNQNIQLQSRVDQIELRNDRLNDQLVAIQRNEDLLKSNSNLQSGPPKAIATVSPELNPSSLIKQQLEFIQFALQQQQWVVALDKLRLLDQQVDTYVLAESIKLSAHQALKQDYLIVQKFVLQKQNQQTQLSQFIANLDDLIKQQATATQLNTSDQETQYFWQKWIQIDRVENVNPQLSQRKSILKEVEVQLLFAEQAFLSDQYESYQRNLVRALQLLDQMPDPQSKKIQQQVIQLQQIKRLSIPQLKTHAIFG